MRYATESTLLFVLAMALVGTTPTTAQEPNKKPATSGTWKSIFDGKSLAGWQVVEGKLDKEAEYENHGKVEVKDKCIVLGTGRPATGLRCTRKMPKSNYEVSLDGKRVAGSDFFCGMSFPVGDGALTLILGGWGGWVVGLSNVDGERAVDNETCQSFEFKNDHWYPIRVRVTDEKVKVWLDEKELVDLDREGHRFEVTWEMEACLPFGFATWETSGALRNIRYRLLKPEKKPKKK